jgi:hypothetical protein
MSTSVFGGMKRKRLGNHVIHGTVYADATPTGIRPKYQTMAAPTPQTKKQVAPMGRGKPGQPTVPKTVVPPTTVMDAPIPNLADDYQACCQNTRKV